jgi:hypothetical protein
MRLASNALANFPFPVVRLECLRCGRLGRYAKARLIERFGALGTYVLDALGAVNYRDPCRARYAALVKPA